MMKSDRQTVLDWLAEHPGEFTIKEAVEGTGLSMSRLAFFFKNKELAEVVGQKKVPYTGHRGHYHIKVYRRAEA